MAAAALGCSSRKQLCAGFRSVNRATQCDLDRLNKWVQGRSSPRALSVYADFAAVIDTPNPGRWVADCSLEEFAAELAAHSGVDAANLAMPDSLGRRRNPRAAGLFGGVAALSSSFAAYSPAWSSHSHRRLLRGALRLSSGRSGTIWWSLVAYQSPDPTSRDPQETFVATPAEPRNGRSAMPVKPRI
jgi:hypothetical protein